MRGLCCSFTGIKREDRMNRGSVITLAGVATLLLSGGIALAGPAVTSVPEPASLTLMAGGVGLIAVVRYLRKK